jgi:hypothetical protein
VSTILSAAFVNFSFASKIFEKSCLAFSLMKMPSTPREDSSKMQSIAQQPELAAAPPFPVQFPMHLSFTSGLKISGTKQHSIESFPTFGHRLHRASSKRIRSSADIWKSVKCQKDRKTTRRYFCEKRNQNNR